MDKVGQEGINALQRCVDLLGGKKPMPDTEKGFKESFRSIFGENFDDLINGKKSQP